jgi:hypothetical protein
MSGKALTLLAVGLVTHHTQFAGSRNICVTTHPTPAIKPKAEQTQEHLASPRNSRNLRTQSTLPVH